MKKYFECLVFITIFLYGCQTHNNSLPISTPATTPEESTFIPTKPLSTPTVSKTSTQTPAQSIGIDHFTLALSLTGETFDRFDSGMESAVHFDSSGDWIIIENGYGIIKYSPTTGDSIIHAMPEEYQSNFIGIDSQYNAWLWNIHGKNFLYRWDWSKPPEKLANFWVPSENSPDLITTDAQGNLWWRSYQTINRFNGSQWTTWHLDDLEIQIPEAEEYFRFVLDLKVMDAPYQVWTSSCLYGSDDRGMQTRIGGDGARWWDGSKWQGKDTPVGSGCISYIKKDQDGIIWILQDDTLWKHDPLADTWNDYPFYFNNEAYYQVTLKFIDISPSGIPWVQVNLCTQEDCDIYLQELFYIDNGEWITTGFKSYEGYSDLIFAPDGTPWILSFDGIYKITNSMNLEMMADVICFGGAFDENGTLWITAAETSDHRIVIEKTLGLYRLDNL